MAAWQIQALPLNATPEIHPARGAPQVEALGAGEEGHIYEQAHDVGQSCLLHGVKETSRPGLVGHISHLLCLHGRHMAKTRGRHSSQPQLPSRSFTFILNEGDRRVTPQISLQLHQTLHALVVVSFQGPGATFLEIFGTEPCAIPCANLRPQGLKPLIDSSIVACGTEVAIVQHHLGAQLDRIVGPPQLRMPHQEVLGQEIKRCSSWKQNETNNMGSELVKTIYMCVCVPSDRSLSRRRAWY